MNRKLIIFFKVLCSSLLLWFLVHTSKLDFTLLTHVFYSPLLLCFTIILYFSVIAIGTWRWHKLNRIQGIPLNYTQTFLPTYLGVAFNNLLPGGVGGDFFRYYFINKNAPTKRSVVMLSVFLDRVTGLLGIFLAVGFFSLFNIKYFSSNPVTHYFLMLSLAISCGILFFCSSVNYLPENIGISRWFKSSALLSLFEALNIYRKSPKTMLECLFTSVIIQIIIALTCMLIARMMHFPALSMSDYIMAIAFTQIANLIPIAPGGFGIGEMAFANILMLLNPDTNAMYATIFLAYRLIGIFTYLPGLSVFVLEKHHLKTAM